MRDLTRSESTGEVASWEPSHRQPCISLRRPRSRRWKSNMYRHLPNVIKIALLDLHGLFSLFMALCWFHEFSLGQFVIWLALCAVMAKQILCTWTVNVKLPWHVINLLLTNLAGSSWWDIGLILIFLFIDLDFVLVHKRVLSRHLDWQARSKTHIQYTCSGCQL